MAINNILIPTDFSDTADLAVAYGIQMAKLFQAKIYLLHSIETSRYSGSGEPVLVQESDVYKLAELQLNKASEEIKKKYKANLTALLVSGKTTTAITDAVKENNINIIIMGTHGASGFEEVFMDSNANKVAEAAACPVISIRSAAKNTGFSTIVMPISNDLHSRQKVKNVIELASKYNSTVHALGILEKDDDETDEKRFKIKMETVESALKAANIKFTIKLVKADNPAEEALKFSEQIGADLIVVLNDQESDLKGVATQIVNHSKIPVMSICPENTTIETFNPAGGDGSQ